MDLQTVRKTAREKLGGVCRVCPVCDGVICAGEVPGMGGVGTGTAFRNNIQALAGFKLNLRTVHHVSQPKLACTILGIKLSAPVIGAAIGGIALNLNAAMNEREYTGAIVSGCSRAGIIGMTGDGPKPEFFAAGLEAVRAGGGQGIPVIKPRETGLIVEMANQAAAAGAPAFGIDIDAAALMNMTNAGQPVGPKTPADLEYIKKHTRIPFIVKGIMTVDEAEACCTAGADAIVVSNHGGRALDHTPGTAEVLPYIAEAVGERLTVLADGGVRSGADVLKMLALGARAVLVGRPFALGAIGAGDQGVTLIANKLIAELQAAMILTGTADINTVSEETIW
ncbi:alpha-hydroxy-acid oxidizing protein|uniref:L-lactate oxidase n=1 Tax=Dendrosporobacter quercicolus TaxID=146817 RepID=A0A1G9YWV0_9FIRM|nr:alpha-hydroxy-acid oxidizing protein [Dendrosporobacter quercicolus]NSL49276.1 alpha-hydroxy-acid oxidizing protein [Dendrosporobacter quercicolus DSM 1736]SDN13612.1 FMN-dependent dehydrogenase, includes L-lactate dehydrogenase and type II isopentenyl diphosphate isomerase [Dendrosporobacter quercicolus]